MRIREWKEDIDTSDRSGQLRKASASYAQRRRAAGWQRIALWVPEDQIAAVHAFVASLGEPCPPVSAGEAGKAAEATPAHD